MTEETLALPDPRDSLSLKLQEAEVDTKNPWNDDVLSRKEIADRLTTIVRDQSEPFVISLHGTWGTGKTFLLKRWQKELENQEFKAIYFNAWEEDFFGDPLLAILGQLYDHFEKSGFEEAVKTLFSHAAPLLKANISGVLNHFTGLTLDSSASQQEERDLLKEYVHQRTTKDALKNALTELATNVVEETGRSLVLIIDELDRCRPTYAIELIERIKHIFDVSNILFVLGVNRDELCNSLKSVYGEIDADTYLRRFFDMEFTLPPINAEAFGKHLIKRYNLRAFYDDLSKRANDRVHSQDIIAIEEIFPGLWGRLSLSLRDIDYCVRLIAFVGRNIELRNYMVSYLLGLLVTLKLKNPSLYQRYIHGQCLGSEIMDFVYDSVVPMEPSGSWTDPLIRCEIFVYFADNRESAYVYPGSTLPRAPALEQLLLLHDGKPLTHPQYLARRTKEEPPGSDRLKYLIQDLDGLSKTRVGFGGPIFPANALAHVANLIELGEGFVMG